MAEKWPSNHQKPFFNIYMMFGQHFKHFFKNRKKSIFKIFFRICINKIGRILIFRPEIGQKSLELEKPSGGFTTNTPPSNRFSGFEGGGVFSEKFLLKFTFFETICVFYFLLVYPTKVNKKLRKIQSTMDLGGNLRHMRVLTC